MEVRVESAAGFDLPPGCYVGVRVGDVLKQGRYEPQRCYHFPTMERRRNAKIDIYRHVGSCIVAVDPDAKSFHEVSVASSDPTVPEMKLKVNVQQSAVDVGKQREAKTKAVKNQAKDYLSKFSIEEKLSEAVKALLREQPADPTDFLCRFLSGDASLPSSPVAGGAAKVPRPSPAEIDWVVHSSAHRPLGKPSGPAVPKPFNGYYTANCLPSPSEPYLNSVYAKFPAAAENLQPKNPAAPRAPAGAPAKTQQDLSALRRQARDVLVKASEDGGLASALKDVRIEDGPKRDDFELLPSVGTWLARPQAPKKFGFDIRGR